MEKYKQIINTVILIIIAIALIKIAFFSSDIHIKGSIDTDISNFPLYIRNY